jgi:rfaE bifunctional protein, domain II
MHKLEDIKKRIVSINDAQKKVSQWKGENQTIVFTNGCFDILHKGHVSYLFEAASFGNKLVVGINADASVKRLNKGSDRPINEENARAFLIAALSCVALVVIFEEETPKELIEKLSPNCLVKGGDYDANETNRESKKYIVGSEHVKKNGGEVKTIDLVEGFSSTSIINKMKSN